MTPKTRRRLMWLFVLCTACGFLAYATREFWARQFKIYRIGHLEVRAQELGLGLPEVDSVAVFVLGNPTSTDFERSKQLSGYTILAERVISGEAAEQLAELWRWLPRNLAYSAMCHHPGYALRFTRGGAQLLETTVCWECNNYSLPGLGGSRELWGFDAKSEGAQQLLQQLAMLVPKAK